MKRLIALFLLAATAHGCGVNAPRASDTRTCDDIAIAPLQALLSQRVTPTQMEILMAEAYKAPLDSVESTIFADDGSTLVVRKGGVVVDQSSCSLVNCPKGLAGVLLRKEGITYSIEMEGDVPVSARILFDTLPMSSGKAISCAGEPDLYHAYYAFGPTATDHLLSIHLFVSRKGVVIYASTFGKTPVPPKLTDDIPVTFLDIVIPSGHESTVEALLRNSPPESEYGRRIRQGLKAWPGNWQDIQIEIDPALQ